MRRSLMWILWFGLSATFGQAELRWHALAVTATSQTYLLPAPQAEVTMCNVGTNEAYYRLFWDGEIEAAATTSDHLLPAGTGAAPFCVSIGTAPTQPAPWRTITIICAGGETATVNVQSE